MSSISKGNLGSLITTLQTHSVYMQSPPKKAGSYRPYTRETITRWHVIWGPICSWCYGSSARHSMHSSLFLIRSAAQLMGSNLSAAIYRAALIRILLLGSCILVCTGKPSLLAVLQKWEAAAADAGTTKAALA